MKVPFVFSMEKLPPPRGSKEYEYWKLGEGKWVKDWNGVERFKIINENILDFRIIDVPGDLSPQICVSEISLRSREEQDRIRLEVGFPGGLGYDVFAFNRERFFFEYMESYEHPHTPQVRKKELPVYVHSILDISDCRDTVALAVCECQKQCGMGLEELAILRRHAINWAERRT